MNEEIDYNALNWVRQELDEVLRQACVCLGEYAGNRDNIDSLHECAKHLLQARDPLRMVGLKGADQLASEMEEVIADLQHGTLAQPDAVIEMLQEAFLQLPDYLSRIRPGCTDNPLALLPVVNGLRALRDVPVLDERAVFAPDLTVLLPPDVYTARMSVSDKKIHDRAQAARSRFQPALLEWYRAAEGNCGLQGIHDVLVQLQKDAGRECVARLWWAAACVSAAMIEGEIAVTPETRRMFGQLDRQIKRLADVGESVFEDPLTDELMRSLLYCIAGTQSSLPCMQSIKAVYKLQNGTGDRAVADKDMAACSDKLLQTISQAAAGDIERIKDRLERFMRATRRDPGDLLPVADELHALGAMFDMAGMVDPGVDVLRQAQLVRSMATGEIVIDESALMDAANSLHAAVQAVDGLHGRGAVVQDAAADSVDVPVITGLQVIGADADEEIVAIFIEEADEMLAQLDGQLTAWFADLENTLALQEVRRGFHTIKGSGRMVGALATGEFAWAFENLLNRVIEGAVVPGAEVLDLLGQSVPAMTQLLARVKDSDALPVADVDAMVRTAMMLCQPVTQPADTPAAAVPVEAASAEPLAAAAVLAEKAEDEPLAAAAVPAETAEDEPLAAAAVPAETAADEPLAAAAVPVEAGDAKPIVEAPPENGPQQRSARTEKKPATGDQRPVADPYAAMDSELLEVFTEEASEIIDAGENTLRAWSEQPDSMELMTEFQRQLHTLKGGARMVDIPPIGDLSHTLESLLERVVDGQIEVNAELFVLLHDSHDHLAEMLEHVKARELPADADKLQTVIDVLHREPVAADDAAALDSPAAVTACPDEADHGLAAKAAAGDDAAVQRENEPLSNADAVAGPVIENAAVPAAERASEPPVEAESGRTAGGETAAVAGAEAGFPLEADAEPAAAAHAGPAIEADAEPAVAPHAAPVTAEPAVEPAESAVTKDQAKAEPAVEPAASPVTGDRAKNAALTDAPDIPPAVVNRRGPEQLPPRVERRKNPRVRSEQVRVRSDLLDSMVNHAAEINIYRGRMEQQISDYRHNLGELDQTIRRLREQLRQVEMETEAHIHFRYEQQGESAGQEFDPLEMDRYSNLQQLSRSLIESIGDLRSLQELMENTTRESEALLLQQSRVSADLQEGLLRSRMIPFAGLAPRLRRILRQSAKELGKEVNLKLEGADGEMDRTVIDRMIAPLEHMLRNAVAHGIEEPAIREQQGKSPAGTLKIGFDREGPEIVLRIEDDGAGLDIEAIRRRAVERKLLDADADIADSDIMQFVLQTGFSTAVEVTQISGRGVGLDVVNGEVRQLGGSLHISSIAGAGTTFTVRLPYTLALNQALLVKAGEETFCIPLGSIEGVARLFPQELAGCYREKDGILEYADNNYRLQHLGSLLGCGGMEQGMQQSRVPVLLTRLGEKRVAFQLESILGSREIVIKPLGAQLRGINGISGATILGDGRVVLILDIMSLSRLQGRAAAPDMTASSRGSERLHVMVVDDSITVRKVTSRLLERNGFRVLTAKDGVDALGQLRENVPDIMLLDIEMPRMDGFELATHMRNDERLKHVPIIMITSRTGDKHRQHAKQIGVNIYLGKPYQESELLDSIQRLIDVDDREACA